MKEYIIFENSFNKAEELWKEKYDNSIVVTRENYLGNKDFVIIFSDFKKNNEKTFSNDTYDQYFCLKNLSLWNEFHKDFAFCEEISLDKVIPCKKLNENPNKSESKTTLSPHESFETMRKYSNLPYISYYEKAVDDYHSFFHSANEILIEKFRLWFALDERLNVIERKYEDEFGCDQDDILSLIGFEIFKFETSLEIRK